MPAPLGEVCPPESVLVPVGILGARDVSELLELADGVDVVGLPEEYGPVGPEVGSGLSVVGLPEEEEPVGPDVGLGVSVVGLLEE